MLTRLVKAASLALKNKKQKQLYSIRNVIIAYVSVLLYNDHWLMGIQSSFSCLVLCLILE